MIDVNLEMPDKLFNAVLKSGKTLPLSEAICNLIIAGLEAEREKRRKG